MVKVLAVADIQVLQIETNSIEWMAKHIYGYNFEFSKTTSDEEALQIALEQAPDVILIERLSQTQKAYDIIQELKNNPTICNIPVIGIQDKMYAHEYLNWGYDYFICKWPLVHAHLIRLIGEITHATYKTLPNEDYKNSQIYRKVANKDLPKTSFLETLYRRVFTKR